MNRTFDRMYHQLGNATVVLLFVTLTCYAITLLCAVLGLPEAVISFRGALMSLAYAFAVCLGLFLVASLTAALIRWIDQRSQR
jgi:hypothetical protein